MSFIEFSELSRLRCNSTWNLFNLMSVKHNPLLTTLVLILVFMPGGYLRAQEINQKDIINWIDNNRSEYEQIAMKIWDFAEVGYQEVKSSSLVINTLSKAGFNITKGVADIPTAFVASYGSGTPVIGIIAEYDAVPGLSQAAVPFKKSVPGKNTGHGSGHHLFAAGSTAAAIAVRNWLEESNHSGTIRVYGTPAEEGGSAKVYIARAGLFDDTDVVLHWHSIDRNFASANGTLAIRSARFRFYGISAHAAQGPERARSALDGAEAFTHMINLLREHVPEKTRLHYIYSNGGDAPNVVPDFAEVYLIARHPDASMVVKIWERISSAAKGAAMGTGTKVEEEIMNGSHSLLPNEYLAKLMDANLNKIGGIHYSKEEQKFATAIYDTLDSPDLKLGSEKEIQPIRYGVHMASTDMGDISWIVPSAMFYVASFVPGTRGHTWQAVSVGGTSIGVKSMLNGAKVLSLTAIDLFTNPVHLEVIRKEFDRRRGSDYIYSPLLGDRAPPLDYRK